MQAFGLVGLIFGWLSEHHFTTKDVLVTLMKTTRSKNLSRVGNCKRQNAVFVALWRRLM